MGWGSNSVSGGRDDDGESAMAPGCNLDAGWGYGFLRWYVHRLDGAVLQR